MKDNFSTHANDYALYRPSYPSQMFDYLNSLVVQKEYAWDCGTGNGQVASALATTFQKVFATDISQQQLDHASMAANIEYSLQPAEQTHFPNNFFDLIMVAQAAHWFNFDRFYNEVKRTAKPNAIICLVGYGKLKITSQIDTLIDAFYADTIGPFWDNERKYIDAAYQNIPFPFKEIAAPSFTIRVNWNLQHLIGYLNTWSAVKHFIAANQYNPVTELAQPLERLWKSNEVLEIQFPLFMRLGTV